MRINKLFRFFFWCILATNILPSFFRSERAQQCARPTRPRAGPGAPSCAGGPRLRGCSAQGCLGRGNAGQGWASGGCPQKDRLSLGCSSEGTQDPAAGLSTSLLSRGLANSACWRVSNTGWSFSICARLGTGQGPGLHTPELPTHLDPVLSAPLQKERAPGQAPLWWGLKVPGTQNCSHAGPCALDCWDTGTFEQFPPTCHFPSLSGDFRICQHLEVLTSLFPLYPFLISGPPHLYFSYFYLVS